MPRQISFLLLARSSQQTTFYWRPLKYFQCEDTPYTHDVSFQCVYSLPTAGTFLQYIPSSSLSSSSSSPSVPCYKYPLHTTRPATKAVISAFIRNLITVDTSALRLSLQLWHPTKEQLPRRPIALLGLPARLWEPHQTLEIWRLWSCLN